MVESAVISLIALSVFWIPCGGGLEHKMGFDTLLRAAVLIILLRVTGVRIIMKQFLDINVPAVNHLAGSRYKITSLEAVIGKIIWTGLAYVTPGCVTKVRDNAFVLALLWLCTGVVLVS